MRLSSQLGLLGTVLTALADLGQPKRGQHRPLGLGPRLWDTIGSEWSGKYAFSLALDH